MRRMPSPSPTPAECVPRLITISAIERAVTACSACPRLTKYCGEVARTKRRAFADQDYWGRPVPGFGDPQASLLIVGLAPAAHGGNRTGRVFTGDRSGDFLYAGLHRAGFANQPTSVARGDGLKLSGVYITASACCAPPANKPTPVELARCRPFLQRTLELLAPTLRVILTLGGIAHDQLLTTLGAARRDFPFGHGVRYQLHGSPYILLGCYHVSQQNTFTGRLTPAMFDAVMELAKPAMSRENKT